MNRNIYKAIDLSKYIVSKCVRDNKPISNLQLQKILYYIQKEFLRKKETVAFNEPIQAWEFGPVVPNVYDVYCGAGAMPIRSLYDDFTLINDDDKIIIDKIVEDKCSVSPWTLINDTHKKNGAWDKTFNKGKGNHNIIPLEYIIEEGE